MTVEDDKFAQLLSIFEHASDDQIHSALEASQGNLQGAIDLMLSSTDTSKKRKAQDESLNAFTRLSCPRNRIPLKSRIQLSDRDIHRHLPCVLISPFLSDDLANALLIKMMEESKDWKVRSFSLFGRGAFNKSRSRLDVKSSHTTCFYMDASKQADHSRVPDTDAVYGGIPGHSQRSRPFFVEMLRARDLIQARVQEELDKRDRHPIEIQGAWEPNIVWHFLLKSQVVANRYQGPDQVVGAHADRLTYIGPRPTIASLTLGAERVFRIQKIPSGDSPARSFDVRLPHNSLLIMFPPMQVSSWLMLIFLGGIQTRNS